MSEPPPPLTDAWSTPSYASLDLVYSLCTRRDYRWGSA